MHSPNKCDDKENEGQSTFHGVSSNSLRSKMKLAMARFIKSYKARARSSINQAVGPFIVLRFFLGAAKMLGKKSSQISSADFRNTESGFSDQPMVMPMSVSCVSRAR